MTFEEWWETQKNNYEENIRVVIEPVFKKSWDEAKEQYKPKWISVNDRLPEEGYYPVKILGQWNGVIAKYGKGFELDWNFVTAGTDRIEEEEKITHWMSTPE